MTRAILIVGSSVRAAAQSARRAGLQPLAIDQFADDDLAPCCLTQRVADYPRGIVPLARQFPSSPFMYTGAMENHLQVIADLARDRTLLGNPPPVVRAVRDPWTLREKLSASGLHVPEIRRYDDALPTGEWLSKPLRSGGGIGIHLADEARRRPASSPAFAKTHYWQRYVPGEPVSAQFLGANGEAVLLGVTRQLVGCSWAGADRFWYVGNLGPLTVPSAVREELQLAGEVLARDFGLVGLFGVDAIVRGGAAVAILEVNPRYTAAVEILERSLCLSPIPLHWEACESERLPTVPGNEGTLHGKAILYARRTVVVPRAFSKWPGGCPSVMRFPAVADCPPAGSTIERGSPLCTVFAAGNRESTILSALQDLAQRTYAVVEGSAH
jgi:predicted ATP-grasp superfamily ATP-dependent carboligase